MSKFIIFADARSGSTSLSKLLDSSENVKLCMEPFHPDYSKWNPGEKNYNQSITSSEKMGKVLDEIFEKFNAMKVLSYQFPSNIYLAMLKRKDLKILFLRRKNNALGALSSLIAHQTSMWHKKDMDEKSYENLKPIDIPEMKKMVDYMNELNEKYESFLKKYRSNDYLPLLYENLYSENDESNRKTILEICEFLNISLPPENIIERYMKPSNSKQNQNNLYKQVPNYKQIQETFRDSFCIE